MTATFRPGALRRCCRHARLLASGAALAAALALAPAFGAGDAGETDAAPEQLERLRNQIRELQERIERTRGERDSLQEELRATEEAIAQHSAALRRIREELAAQRQRLERLDEERLVVAAGLAAQRAALARHARAAYITGQQEYLKLLLNQEDPAAVARVMAYYRFLSEERARHIGEARDALARLTKIEDEIVRRNRDLEALEASQSSAREELEDTRAQRKVVLARLDREVSDQSDRIASLRRDEERLTRLLEGLSLYVEELHTNAGPAARFAAARGQLTLPAAAPVAARYGALKEGGPLTWDGVFLRTPRGAEVRAVFGGRVAFAGWFGGLGQLLILDHGDGYMSLYGHSEQLLVDVGDWVSRGQAIATAGDSGGLSEPGLYFEIRQNGRPQDPLLWCRIR
jgi:septal ring factor EnvC (AmiA/AmiB activator)